MENLSETEQEKFLRRKLAVELCLQGELYSRIQQQTGIERSEVRRLAGRCLQVDEEGVIWGYRALVPSKRVKKYERKKKDASSQGHSGEFSLLLEQHPEVEQYIRNAYHSKDSLERATSTREIWQGFLAACRKEGIQPHEYPFNTVYLGLRAVQRFLKVLDGQHFYSSASRFGQDAAQRAKSTGFTTNRPMVRKLFSAVQFDGHRIDAIFEIEIRTQNGDVQTVILERLWLLIAMDTDSRAVLGYHLCLNKEYTAFDVLACFRNAIMPWKPKNFDIPGIGYGTQSGFPSGKYAQVKWAAWDVVMMDNGKANLANVTLDRLLRVLDCSVNLGPVATPIRRSLVESLFRILEEYGYHQLITTTGSSPDDPRRTDPEKMAKKYKVSLSHLEQLTEVIIANYNATPHSSLGYLSPLEVIGQRIADELPIHTVPLDKREEVEFLTIQEKRVVQGSVKTGRRPYIEYLCAEYTSDVLSRSADLIGTEITLVINTEDLRVVKAFLPDGSEFGLLEAKGPWGRTAHSLTTRKEINRLRSRKVLYLGQSDDWILAYKAHLREEAIGKRGNTRNTIPTHNSSKGAANRHARLEKESPVVDVTPSQTNNANATEDSKVIHLLSHEVGVQQDRKRRKTIIRSSVF